MAALKYMFSRTTVALVGGGSCFGLGYWFSENEDRLLSRSKYTENHRESGRVNINNFSTK